MLQWNEMHPYNAVHVVRVPRPLEPAQLLRIIDGELEHLGLTGLVLDKRKGTFEYRGGSVQNELKWLDATLNPQASFEKEMEAQLNTSFEDDGAINPFRFFVIKEEESFYLGLAYFHVMAGAESIILLLKSFVDKYMGQKGPDFIYPLDRYPQGYGSLVRLSPTALIQRIFRLRSLIRNLRRSSKPRYQDVGNQDNGISLLSLTGEQYQALQKTAKKWAVTLNDLFLGVLLQSLSPLAGRRFSSARRKMISVGSIVNIRRDLGIDSLKTFGLFLGSFVVSHPVPERISLEHLTKEIHHETEQIKRNKLYLETPMELWLGRLLVSFRSFEQRERFYTSQYPLWGGITNMNLNLLWEQRNEAHPFNYFRAVSTGPITPLVLSITTVGNVVNIGLSFKKTVFSQLGIKGFISNMMETINHLEGGL